MLIEIYRRDLDSHLSEHFGPRAEERIWTRGAIMPNECRVLIFGPNEKTGCWIYATCGMTYFGEQLQTEMFLMSPTPTDDHIELLTAIAHYHQTDTPQGPEHTLNFGRPWLPQSACTFGLLTQPYTFGPELAYARLAAKDVQVLWLVPITEDEREFKIAKGIAELEKLFEQKQFNYLDPLRPSVIDITT